jgi:hypothetical protein
MVLLRFTVTVPVTIVPDGVGPPVTGVPQGPAAEFTPTLDIVPPSVFVCDPPSKPAEDPLADVMFPLAVPPEDPERVPLAAPLAAPLELPLALGIEPLVLTEVVPLVPAEVPLSLPPDPLALPPDVPVDSGPGGPSVALDPKPPHAPGIRQTNIASARP